MVLFVISGNQYNREVRVIPVDFTDGQSVYAHIQAEISDLDVAVLGEKPTCCHSFSVVKVLACCYSFIFLPVNNVGSVHPIGALNDIPETVR